MPRIFVTTLLDEQYINECFMVKGRELKSFRNKPSYFLNLVLGDKTGNVKAVVWEDAERIFNQIRDGDVVRVTGRPETYNGNPQLIVERLSMAKDGDYELADFLPSSPRDIGLMEAELLGFIGTIGAPLRDLLEIIFAGDTLSRFSQTPAAKVMHHAYLGGLLEHTLEVIRLCLLATEIYPGMDRDLLLTGAILHDIGKIKEYVYTRDIDFSDQGKLLGHIVLGDEMVAEKLRLVPGMNSELSMRLRHMILSHHGHYEWQSPKRPKTLEATVLHQSDFFSGEVAKFATALQSNANSQNQWSRFNEQLERQIYLGGKRNSVLRERGLMEEEEDPY